MVTKASGKKCNKAEIFSKRHVSTALYGATYIQVWVSGMGIAADESAMLGRKDISSIVKAGQKFI
jgi:hypothetical protein